MNVLVIGNGGREHALCHGIKNSNSCDNLFCVPGSDGIAQIANCFNINISDHILILNFCVENKIDFVVIGPEVPLTEGLSDYLEMNSILTFGPSKAGAELENSKKFTKDICKKLNIPTANYVTFDNYVDSMNYLNSCSFPLVIKADGLAAGKGVIVCNSVDDAISAIETILVKRFVSGLFLVFMAIRIDNHTPKIEPIPIKLDPILFELQMLHI